MSRPIRIRACGLLYRLSSDGPERSDTPGKGPKDAPWQVLLVRVRVPTRPAPIWMAPGGAVEPGETLAEAARREIMEETSLPSEQLAGPLILAAFHEFVEPPFHALEWYFQCVPHPDDPARSRFVPRPDPDDPAVLDARWVDLHVLTELSVEPAFLGSAGFHRSLLSLTGTTPEPIRHFVNGRPAQDS